MKLLVATHNRGKMREFADLIGGLGIEWVTLQDAGISHNVSETGQTLLQNATLKAETYARLAGLLTLADDTGLEIDALGGEPGIYPARYGGPSLSSVERYQLVLQKLAGVALPQRTARFRCVIALAGSEGLIGAVEGVCEGMIALQPAGTHGFGYDPIFYIPERGQTMAELSPEQKQLLSHRGRAMRAMIPLLEKRITGQ